MTQRLGKSERFEIGSDGISLRDTNHTGSEAKKCMKISLEISNGLYISWMT